MRMLTIVTNLAHQRIRDLGVSMGLAQLVDVMRYLGRVT